MFFVTKDGNTHLLVNPQSAALIESKLGLPVSTSAVDESTVSNIMARDYKQAGGWGYIGRKRAEVLCGSPRSYNPPIHSPSDVSIVEYSSRMMRTERGLENIGYRLPDWAKEKSSEVRDPVPLNKNKEDAVQAKHTQLLEKIAANTAVLPEIKRDLAAIRKVLADYDAGRITKDERDRRINRWVN